MEKSVKCGWSLLCVKKEVLTMTEAVLDGGYYAIKGFNFQYDYTLLQILEQTDATNIVEIEQFEDYSDTNYIVQVKYKEKTSFSNSSIKRPICQLLEIFKEDKRHPVLYCYFNNVGEEERKLSLEDLNSIIGNCRVKNRQYVFTEDLKKDFIAKFTLIFTAKYQDQFEALIEKIKSEFNCGEDEALVYYSQMYKYIERKVIDNPPENKANRVCFKEELLEIVQSARKVVFYSSYSEIMGKQRYYNFIYRKFFREVNRNYHERFFIIELSDQYSLDELKKIAIKLKDRFFTKRIVRSRTTITSPAPYILFHGVRSEDLRDLKVELQAEGYSFRDGFSFENAEYFLGNLIEECNPQNNIEIKFINKIDYLPEILNAINRVKKVYSFYTNEKKNNHIDSINISLDEINDIYEYLF
jgi:hypothetical protein